MVLQGKAVKRHSFSVENLAISSRLEDTERDTDSPYLQYLKHAADHAASTDVAISAVDVNSNYANRPWPVHAHLGAVSPPLYDICRGIPPAFHDVSGTNARGPDLSKSAQVTSTPKEPSRKRRRSCSTSSPPSSDESHYSGDRTEESMSTSGDMEKLSPAFSTSASSDGDVDERGSKRKKARTAFSGEQLRELESRYKSQKYLTASDRSRLARSLKLKDQQVKTWFQNRRMKEKRQQRDEEQAHGFCLPTGGVDISQLAALGICPPPYGYQLTSPTPVNHQFPHTPSAVSPNVITPHSPAGSITPSLRPSTDLSTSIPRPIPSTFPLPELHMNLLYPEPVKERIPTQTSLLSPPSLPHLNQPTFVTDSHPAKLSLPAPVALHPTTAALSKYSFPFFNRQSPVPYMQFVGQHY